MKLVYMGPLFSPNYFVAFSAVAVRGCWQTRLCNRLRILFLCFGFDAVTVTVQLAGFFISPASCEFIQRWKNKCDNCVLMSCF